MTLNLLCGTTVSGLLSNNLLCNVQMPVSARLQGRGLNVCMLRFIYVDTSKPYHSSKLFCMYLQKGK